MSKRELGQHVIYVDELGVERNALVTCIHFQGSLEEAYEGGYCVNLVYVSGDPTREDGYGRQMERASSVSSGESANIAHGRYWRLA